MWPKIWGKSIVRLSRLGGNPNKSWHVEIRPVPVRSAIQLIDASLKRKLLATILLLEIRLAISENAPLKIMAAADLQNL